MRLSDTVMEIWRLKDMYTDGHNTARRTHGKNDQSRNLLPCSLRSHLAEIEKN